MVSIGLPIYNCANRIRSVLDALLAQTYQDIEIIISDDGSSDDSVTICEEYAKRDPRIRVFRQAQNIGYLRNFEFVVAQARGQYFMWAADDDWWDPRCVATLKAALTNNPEHGLAMPSLKQVYDDGTLFEEVRFVAENDLTNKHFFQVFQAAINKTVPVQFCYYGLFRMPFLQKLLAQPFADTIAHDKVFMMEVALSTHIVTISEILWHKTTYRQLYYERYTPEMRSMFTDRRGYARYIQATIARLARSRAISWYRKLLLPIYALMLIWAEKKNLFRQLFPHVFSRLRSIKKHGSH